MNDKVNLAQKLATFDEVFQPKIVGYYNENKLLVGKMKGEFVWHSHPDTDDFFLVVSGRMTIQLRDREVELGPRRALRGSAWRRALPALGRGGRDPPHRVEGNGEHRRLGSRAGTRGRDLSRVKLVWFVPEDALDVTRDAVFAAGAGRIGDYERCSWYAAGTGTFLGVDGTAPTLGESGREEHVAELRVETVVPADRLSDAVAALRAAHPYEEPAFDVYPLLEP